MQLQPYDKKALSVLGAVAVAAAVIIAVATTLLVTLINDDDERPMVSLATGDGLVHAEAVYWCGPTMTDCEPKGKVAITATDAPVAIDENLLLTVPSEVSEGPWALTAEYATPHGIQEVDWLNASNSLFTKKLRSTPDKVLTHVEIRVLSRTLPQGCTDIDDNQCQPYARGLFAIDTTPKGFTVRNQTVLAPKDGD